MTLLALPPTPNHPLLALGAQLRAALVWVLLALALLAWVARAVAALAWATASG